MGCTCGVGLRFWIDRMIAFGVVGIPVRVIEDCFVGKKGEFWSETRASDSRDTSSFLATSDSFQKPVVMGKEVSFGYFYQNSYFSLRKFFLCR